MSIALENLHKDSVTSETIIDTEHAFYGVIQPKNKTADYSAFLKPYYSQEARLFYPLGVEAIDKKLQEKARLGNDPLVRIVFTADEVRVSQDHIDREIERTLVENEMHLTVGSFYGVQRPFMRVRNRLSSQHPEAATRLSGAIVSSTNETKRESPKLLTPLDPRWGDPAFSADIWEDLADSATTPIAIALERIKGISGGRYKPTYPDLPSRMLRGVDGNFGDFAGVYHEAVALMEEANIALALPVSKNETFVNVLWQHTVAHAGSPWAIRQGRYLTGGPLLMAGQHQWLMGADQFDSGLDGKKIYEYVPDGVRNNPKFSDILAPLPYSRLRIGSYIQDIVELKGTAEDLYAFVGKTLGENLRAF